MGSIFHTNIVRSNMFLNTIGDLKAKNFCVIISDMHGNRIDELKIEEKIIITFSNESHGASSDLRKIADHRITIPKYGDAESLNVSSAAAVILSSLKR